MSKAILISIKPKWVAKILNGEKTIEIRKRFPKDFVGWIYIYCTKDKKYANLINRGGFLSGMVVARFWCDKVEEIKWDYESPALSKYTTQDLDEWELCNKSCLTGQKLIDYLGKENSGYAIHITKLEIFEKPKEISEFKSWSKCQEVLLNKDYFEDTDTTEFVSLNRAPESFCYIEID